MFILIAVVILVFAVSLAMAFANKHSGSESFEERLRQMSRNPETIDLNDLELSKPFSERIILPFVERIGHMVAKITPQEVLKEAAKKIQQSGMKLKPGVFVTTQFLMAIIFPSLLAAMGIVSKAGNMKGIGMLLFSGFLGYFMPDLWLKSKVGARKSEITRKLPDALDLLMVSVEAGLAFDMALSKVVEKLQGPLAEEFMKCLHEIRMGKPRREAMKNMAARADVPDLSSFISALVQADKLGVSLANVLRVQSDQMRLKRRQRAEETAMKAPLKMSFVLVFFVLPALLIVLLGPAAISVIEQLKDNAALQ
jgi:tight adherence protein C